MVLTRILFCLLMAFLGFCAGMAAGSLFVPKGSGLAGPAIAFWYGLAGLIVGIIIALILIRFLRSGFRTAFIIVLLLSLAMIGWIVYRVITITGKQTSAVRIPVHQTTSDAAFHFAVYKEHQVELPIGTGMAQPHLLPDKPLYFYGYDAVYSMPEHLTPTDSVTFKKGQYYIDIATAPPWLVPEILKLDYNMFYLRTLTVSKNWLEVIVNNTNGQTAWISRDDAAFVDWHYFFLHVAAVEVIDAKKNPLRLKPLDYAGILAPTAHRFQFTPIAVQGDWIMVSTNGLANKIPPAGWIRWRDGNKMLIRYSVLS